MSPPRYGSSFWIALPIGAAVMVFGAIGLIGCLLVWFFIATRSPFLGWIGLAGMILAWIAGLVWIMRR